MPSQVGEFGAWDRMQHGDQIKSALARLTENEKECLRRRLWPQTAKEMAVDLGISPHAVEKRLKMARTKFGLTSSLAAARLLADEERYQPLVPDHSELPSDAAASEEEPGAASGGGVLPRGTLYKGHRMFAALFPAALVAQDMPGPTVSPTATETERLESISTRKVGMDEAAAFVRLGFRDKDKDGSGELNARETSQMEPRDNTRAKSLPAAPDPFQFVRIQRSAIVNLRSVALLERRSHGEFDVVMSSGSRLVMSRTYRGHFEKMLGQPL